MSTEPSLSTLKTGDMIIVHKIAEAYTSVVTRLTKTQIKVRAFNFFGQAFEESYRQTDGMQVGGTQKWHKSFITIPKEGEIEKLTEEKEHNERCAALEKLNWRAWSISTVKQVHSLISQERRKREEANKLPPT